MAESATQPTTAELPPRRRQASSWFFYFVAAALGLSFSGVLLLLAWDNAVEAENRALPSSPCRSTTRPAWACGPRTRR